MFLFSNGQPKPKDSQDDKHAVWIEDGIPIHEDFEALIRHIYGQCIFPLVAVRIIDWVDVPGGLHHHIQFPFSFQCWSPWQDGAQKMDTNI